MAENKTIDQLDPASAFDGTEEIPVWQGGATKKGTANQFATLLGPKQGRTTTGDATLALSDNGTSLVSSDSGPVNLFLPTGLPAGFRVRSYQGASGQISYVPGAGASVVDGTLRSLGRYTSGYFVDIENLGGDQWIVLGNTTPGLQNWNITGHAKIKEGDVATFAIWRPDLTASYPNGVSLRVTGTGFGSSGFDMSLEQALTLLTKLDSNVTFDGVDTITIKPAARNPLPLNFFAVPDYAATSDRDVTITISDPTVGSVSQSHVTTTILDVSKPTSPDLLFPKTTITVASTAASGQNQITLNSVAGLEVLGTVTGSVSIPALTWITSINGNTISLSANLTGSIAGGTQLTHTPPGLWLDFSTSTGMTLDGSNHASVITDKLNGYTLGQATSSAQPTYLTNALNGLGGLYFNRAFPGQYMTSTADPICKFLDAAKQKYTIVMVCKLKSASVTGTYFAGIPFSAQMNTSISAFTIGASYRNVTGPQAVNVPFIWQSISDGTSDQTRCNGQRVLVPVTLTADLTGSVATVDDSSSINPGMVAYFGSTQPWNTTTPDIQGTNNGIAVNSVPNSTTINLNQSVTKTIPAGTTIYFYTAVSGNVTPYPVHASSIFVLGADASFNNKIDAEFYEIIMVPRMLSAQEWRGLTLYLSNKWGTTITQTTAASSAAGSNTIALSSVTGINTHQVVSGTGIKTGSTVVKVNQTTNVITLDNPLTGNVANGATLSFKNCSFKAPDLLDVTQLLPAYRDDFALGVQFANSGPGWQPYYGLPSKASVNPATYGSAGHGSSNNGAGELEWYLDVLNWTPWLKYNPFSLLNDADAAVGAAVITASPTPAEIADLVGYTPPQPTAYPYISGYIKSLGAFYQQYGYWEARVKVEAIAGSWAAFWLTAADLTWPPEIDILEAYGTRPDNIYCTVHQNPSFSTTSTGGAVGLGGDLTAPISEEYVLVGANVTPTAVDFYINREKVASTGMSWDFHTPWYMQANLAITNSVDRTSSIRFFLDYMAAWKPALQTPVVPTSTQAETTALLNAMTVSPSGARQTLINTVIAKAKSYKTVFGTPLWDALDFLYITAAHDAQAARINWKNPAQVGSVVGSPAFTVDRGYVGSKDVSYIDTGLNLSTASPQMTATQNHIGGMVRSVAASNGNIIGSTNYYIRPNSGMTMVFSNFNTVQKSVNTLGTPGHYVCSRNHYHLVNHFNGGYTSGLPQGSSNNVLGPDNETLRLANGGSQVCCAHGGIYLTPDDVSYLYQILNEYLVAIGAM